MFKTFVGLGPPSGICNSFSHWFSLW